jgi:transposase
MRAVRWFCASSCGAGQVVAFFAALPRCVVGLEACATAH